MVKEHGEYKGRIKGAVVTGLPVRIKQRLQVGCALTLVSVSRLVKKARYLFSIQTQSIANANMHGGSLQIRRR
jgi:hypothetical protein